MQYHLDEGAVVFDVVVKGEGGFVETGFARVAEVVVVVGVWRVVGDVAGSSAGLSGVASGCVGVWRLLGEAGGPS